MSRVARAAAGLLAIGLALALFGAASASAATLPPGFQDSVVFSGLEEPTMLRFAPDGRVFVAEKQGKILVYDSLEDETPELFADIRTQVYDSGDRGILSFALDPEFDEGRPYIYVLYTYDHVLGEPGGAPKWGEANHTGDACPKPESANVDACPVSGRLVRLTAEGNHAKLQGGVPLEEVVLENWCQQFSSHSIGDLQFGPEGALYASGGDGASFSNADYGQFGWPQPNECGDPPGNLAEVEAGTSKPLEAPTAEGGALRALDALTPEGPFGEDPTSLDGSVVRVDPDTGTAFAGNPKSGSSDPNEARIVGFGFRNPFRFTIDPTTDELYVDNVGWGEYEEIDRFPAVPSQQYDSGWPCWEGPEFAYVSVGLNVCNKLISEPGSTSQPFFYYTHVGGVTPEDPCPTERGSAITGITFYEGSALPSKYHGALFFADAVRGCIYVMFPGEDGRPNPATAEPFMTEATAYAGVDIEVGPEGDLYYVSLAEGQIHRIAYFSGNQPPIARLTVDHQWSAGDLTAVFDASGSSDPEGEPLEYEWDTNEDGVFSEPSPDPKVSREWTEPVDHKVAVRVVDGHGLKSVATLIVYPHDTPPEPQITAPEESSSEPGKADLEWHVGQQIHFEGSATDAEEGDLQAVNLGWNSRILHCPFGPETCHFHPLQAFPGKAGGTLIAPDHDYPSRIVLTLTATDSRGLAATKTIELYPHPVQLQIESQPAGIQVTAGLLSEPTPFALTAIEGSSITLAAPQTATVGGTTYEWTAWSDGGARVHTVQAGATFSDKATYAAVGSGGGGKGGEAERPAAGGPQSAPGGPPPVVVLPQTAIGRHPSKHTRSRTARFVFTSSVVGSRFRCRLDLRPFRSCRSPLVFHHLRPGPHALEVDAVGPTGLADSTPAIFDWTVRR